LAKPKLRIIPFGGVGEIGKNMTVLEYGNSIIVIDCGVMFPEDSMPGIDLVIPDVSYLLDKKQKVKAFYHPWPRRPHRRHSVHPAAL
jgi:ribonuclease J